MKTKPSVIDDAQHLHQLIVLTRYLSSDLKDVKDPVIKRNGFFGHPENVLISMLADDRNHISPSKNSESPQSQTVCCNHNHCNE
ncbi:hypothetical protein AVEN_227354-1 [Araneus ventricosus]|uniref:Uncharacterized protein n=1 Tax=Araneus ventricosus TaxID=182803 RepID=A0A4Y2GV95_ARAVE|nr:hypothetical protein AVEN_227354-1 [Araneus ventricosus]